MKSVLRETAKWAKFLAIVGFVMVGLMVLGVITILFAFSNTPQSSILGQGIYQGLSVFGAIFYLIIAAIVFFPYLYLYRFSVKMQSALKENNEAVLLQSFENHKSYYKFMGIMTLIMIGLYVLIFFFSILGTLLSLS